VVTGVSASRLSRPISDDAVEQYTRDGATCLRGMFDSGWIERLRLAVDHGQGPSVDMTGTDARGRFHGRVRMWQTDPVFRDFVFNSPAAAIARRLMGANEVRFFHDQLFIKEPGTTDCTPWHHDQPYWPVLGEHVCSIWLALDPVTKESSGLEYVKGSHRWRKRFTPADFGSLNVDAVREGGADPIPHIDAHRERYEFLSWDMEPGDCLVHHSLAVHGAQGNSSAIIRRRALSTRWLGDEAYYRPQAGRHDSPYQLDHLEPGQKLEAECFPIVSVVD
jgi:ectoine hydroxylase-related dioxygenase (phytanoyl-CoA dioxygenase family)